MYEITAAFKRDDKYGNYFFYVADYQKENKKQFELLLKLYEKMKTRYPHNKFQPLSMFENVMGLKIAHFEGFKPEKNFIYKLNIEIHERKKKNDNMPFALIQLVSEPEFIRTGTMPSTKIDLLADD